MSFSLVLDSSSLPGSTSDNFRVVYPGGLNLTGGYEIALKSASLWYSWLNVSAEKANNLLRYSTDSGATWKPVLIPDGQYELSAINDFLHSVMLANGDSFINGSGQQDYNISIVANNATLRVVVEIVAGSNYQLDVSASRIYLLFGFNPIIVTTTQPGANLANINDDINSLSIQCDVVAGNYVNGRAGNVLKTFVPTTAPGTNIVITEPNPTYSQVSGEKISGIAMAIVDNLGRRVNLNGQPTTYELHLRPLADNTLTNRLLKSLVDMLETIMKKLNFLR